jgi:ATP-dependent DNA ligase
MRITKKNIEAQIEKLFAKYGRPVHLADLKLAFNIKTKRHRVKRGVTESDKLSRNLCLLYDEGRVAKSETTPLVEDYPTSPYARHNRKTSSHVRFFAPIEMAGKTLSFTLNGSEYTLRFIDKSTAGPGGGALTKKQMAFEVLRESERGLTADEILHKINEKYDAYPISDERTLHNARTSLVNGVLKRHLARGLQGRKVRGKWVWYFTNDQYTKYLEHYVQEDPVLRIVRDTVRNRKCVPLAEIVSMSQRSSEEVRYRVENSGKLVPVTVKLATVDQRTSVELEPGRPREDRPTIIDWLGIVSPTTEHGYGYETMLVDLDSDWVEALRREIKKSLKRINITGLMGYFYEKMVAKLFNIICTSEELQQHPELSKFTIPFVLRDEKVVNVWTTLESGRKAEFDILLRGTFRAFDSMTGGKDYLDIVIPIESKYTVVKPEHVTAFDDKIQGVFGEAGIGIYPIMIALSWSPEAVSLAHKLKIRTLYFTAMNNLIGEMIGGEYRFRDEWEHAQEMVNKGKLSLTELRELVNKMEYRYIFEEKIERRLRRKLKSVASLKTQARVKKPTVKAAPAHGQETEVHTVDPDFIQPMLAYHAGCLRDILSSYPLVCCEYKLDGERLQAHKASGYVKLYSRNGNEVSSRFAEVRDEVLKSVKADRAILDGELVAVDPEMGRVLPARVLRSKKSGGMVEVRYVLFDVLNVNGESMLGCSYLERRAKLEELVTPTRRLSIVPSVMCSGKEMEEFFREARSLGHEGLVAKNPASPYIPGERNREWFKLKTIPETLDLVVVGINWGSGSRSGKIGSLLLATLGSVSNPGDSKFYTVANVGGGLNKHALEELEQTLNPHKLDKIPEDLISNLIPDVWVAPHVVVEIICEGIQKSDKHSAGISLKFARFSGIRSDKTPRDINGITDITALFGRT